MKLIVWTIYLIGLLFIAELAHELYHFYFCGGDFVTGILWQGGKLTIASTWCQRVTNEGETIPTLIEISTFILGVFIKTKV